MHPKEWNKLRNKYSGTPLEQVINNDFIFESSLIKGFAYDKGTTTKKARRFLERRGDIFRCSKMKFRDKGITKLFLGGNGQSFYSGACFFVAMIKALKDFDTSKSKTVVLSDIHSSEDDYQEWLNTRFVDLHPESVIEGFRCLMNEFVVSDINYNPKRKNFSVTFCYDLDYLPRDFASLVNLKRDGVLN